MKFVLDNFYLIVFYGWLPVLGAIFNPSSIWASGNGGTGAGKAMGGFRNVAESGNITGLIVSGIFIAIAIAVTIKFQQVKARLDQKNQDVKAAKEKYKQMVENAEDGILVVQNLKLKYANNSVYEIMGLQKSETISDQLIDYIYPEDLNVVLECYETSVLSRKNENYFKVRLVKKDNSIIWVHIRLVPVVWDDEPANLAFMRDITHQQMLEQDLHQAQRLEALGALSGGIAHDFNNILTTIIGNAEVALMEASETDHGKMEFEQIRESGYRARDLVRQILTISREHTSDVQPLYLSPIIKEALKLLRSTLPKNIQIIENIDKQLNLVKADSIQMYQVFMNLCTNAKHALEKAETPCLEIGLQNVTFHPSVKQDMGQLKPGNYIKLSVKDNGTGIDPDIQSKIFDPYFTTKSREIGTGLGLATTLGIVKQFGGHISFKTEPGKGTCFVVHIPVHEKKESNGQIPDKNDSVQEGGRILFVDDEKEITIIAKRMFTNLGYSVMTAESGTQALESFARAPEFFDLLITDLAMPGMTGEKLANEVMRIRPGFPVIICTGHSDTFDKQKAKECGVMEYVAKPYNLKELSLIASKYIKKSKAA